MSRLSTLVVVLVIALAGAVHAADTYKLDPSHSYVNFRIKHMNTGNSYGRFNEPEGTVTIDADPAKSSFDLTVKADKVDTGNAKRDAHLKGPDFFNVADFPTITFKSTSIKADAGGKWEVTGDLTLHGKTQSVIVQFNKTGEGKDMAGKDRVGFETSLTIKRSDFGITFMANGLGDDVMLWVSFEAAK